MAKMAELAAAALPITRRELSKAEALDFFRARDEPYKVELLQELSLIIKYSSTFFFSLRRTASACPKKRLSFARGLVRLMQTVAVSTPD